MSLKKELEPSDIKKYPPILRIDSDDLSLITKAKVGNTYKLCIDVKVVSLSTGEEYGEVEDSSDKGMKKQKTMASLKVTNIEPMGKDAMENDKPNLLVNAMKKRV